MGASPVWHKSTHSGSLSGECIEVAEAAAFVLVRDSKRPTGPTLRLSLPAWTRFLRHVSGPPSQQAA
ncbi:DUF397 domain-containing protein [Streptomyces sp. NPDC001435]|uniref:DUF397 domain-containing protein n=1 Tax=unclassified Streptomyces TaxID=2593676 RepID=UPI0036B4DB1E